MIKLFRILMMVTFAMMAIPTVAQFGNLRVVETSPTSIKIAWNGSPDDGSYTIEYKRLSALDFQVAGTTTGTSFTIGRLSPKQRYDIGVFASGGGYLSIIARTSKELGTPSLPPYVPTCPRLPAGISVSGDERNTHCQRVDGQGVGIYELIAQGVVDALDVWGVVKPGLRVCFRNQGRLVFLDAAMAPRKVSDLPAEMIDGMTCGVIDRAGTVVLLKGPAGAVVSPPQERATVVAPPPVVETVEVTGCELVTTAQLSLRTGPSVYYARILSMPRDTRLRPIAQSGGWFLVEYEAVFGWVSGEYAAANGGCGAMGEASVVVVFTEMPDPADPDDATEAETAEQALPPGAQPLLYCQLIAGDILNLRAGPGLEHAVEAEIPFFARLSAGQRLGDWFRVAYNGIMGWVNIDYVIRSDGCG